MSQKKMGAKKLKKEETSLEQKQQEAEVKRQRLLVKNVLYPYLLKNAENIIKAKQLCYETSTVLSSAFQKQVMDYQRKLSDSKSSMLIVEDTLKKGDGFKVNQGMLDLFKDETITVANSLILGMQNAIESFINEENSKRELKSLKTTFLD